jgi:hypothetical protein
MVQGRRGGPSSHLFQWRLGEFGHLFTSLLARLRHALRCPRSPGTGDSERHGGASRYVPKATPFLVRRSQWAS